MSELLIKRHRDCDCEEPDACDCREERFKCMEAENDRLRKELADDRHDLGVIIHEVSLAYDAITNGKLSKPNTAYGYIIEAVDERLDQAAKEAEEPLIDRIRELETALRDVEWMGISGCLECNRTRYKGHAPDCLIGLALAEEKGE